MKYILLLLLCQLILTFSLERENLSHDNPRNLSACVTKRNFVHTIRTSPSSKLYSYIYSYMVYLHCSKPRPHMKTLNYPTDITTQTHTYPTDITTQTHTYPTDITTLTPLILQHRNKIRTQLPPQNIQPQFVTH